MELISLLRNDGTDPTLYYIVHQEDLFAICYENVYPIKGGNHSTIHQKCISLLSEIGAEYSYLTLFTGVPWLSVCNNSKGFLRFKERNSKIPSNM